MTGNTWKWIHFVAIIFFVALWAAAWHFRWVESVVFVSHVSMVALVLAEIGAWQASRTEAKQDKQIDENEKRDDKQDETLFGE